MIFFPLGILFRIRFCLFALCFSFLFAPETFAGGGSETTLVVVNARSPLSMRVANEYVALRDIPDSHIVYLNNVPIFSPISINDFRKRIWRPIRRFIESHDLDKEIDIIAYSADFPYAVKFNADLKINKIKHNKYMGSNASLTSLTYFARRVDVADTGYLGKNYYFREFAGPRIKKGLREFAISGPILDKRERKHLRRTAASALRNQDFATAVDAYRRIRDSNPGILRNWYNLARAQAAAGKKEEAIATLEGAVDRGWTQSLMTERDKRLQALHSEPEFKALLRRMESAYGPFQLAQGFRNQYVWSNSDLQLWEPEDVLNRYYLSTMLAYTGVRGNSFPEIMAYLNAAASSDGTQPDGTVYLLENRNVRSTTRQPLFPTTVAQLAKRKRKAEILRRWEDEQDGRIPKGKDDVIGAVLGFYRYKWENSGSWLLPGAIAESLTSYGGHFDRSSQTKLTEFLRHGAAGSSGAVAEPFAIQEKFPVPMLHAYYADGCSLAEAFYQSIAVPYQLIIVGDPLARPFAAFADVRLQAPSPTKTWSAQVALETTVRPARDKLVKKVELWVDGHHVADASAGEPILWDTRDVDDGYHDLRLIAIEDSLIETRSSRRFTIRVANTSLELEIDPDTHPVDLGASIPIRGSAKGVDRVEVYHGVRKLGAAPVHNGRWRLSVDSKELGIGPVALFARAANGDGAAVRSAYLALEIQEPARLKPALAEKPRTTGLSATVLSANSEEIGLTINKLNGPISRLRKPKLQVKHLALDGYFYVGASGFYQLALKADAQVNLAVDDTATMETKLNNQTGAAFLPLGLEAGWHSVRIDLRDVGKSYLKVTLAGEQGTVILSNKHLGHQGTADIGL